MDRPHASLDRRTPDKPTSTSRHSAWQPNPSRRSTYRCWPLLRPMPTKQETPHHENIDTANQSERDTWTRATRFHRRGSFEFTRHIVRSEPDFGRNFGASTPAVGQGPETQGQPQRAVLRRSGRQAVLLPRRHLLAAVPTAQSRGSRRVPEGPGRQGVHGHPGLCPPRTWQDIIRTGNSRSSARRRSSTATRPGRTRRSSRTWTTSSTGRTSWAW